MTGMWRSGVLYGLFVNSLEKQPTALKFRTDSMAGRVMRAYGSSPFRSCIRPLNSPHTPQDHRLLGVWPEASTTIELLTAAEQTRLRQRFRFRWLLMVCLLLGDISSGWVLYREAGSGAPPSSLVAFALLVLCSLRWLPNLLRQCRLAHADYRAGIKQVIRGPLLASERASGAMHRWMPRFRWLIGDILIGIDVNWDFIYIRGAGGRRLRPGDCQAMEHPGLMLEAHMTVVSGMALYVASAA